MKCSFVWAAFALFTSALATPSPKYNIRVKETIVAPKGWTKRDVAPRDLHIDLRIALPQSNFPLLEQLLYEVSDPSHKRYGAHLSQAEVNELIAPQPESLQQVKAWLVAHGVREEDLFHSPARDWIKVRIPVSLAEEMLDAEYHVWEHSGGDTLVRTTSYSLPMHLHQHVDLVQPTTYFSRFRSMKTTFHFDQNEASSPTADNAPAIHVPSASGGKVDPSCNTTITVTCLKELYNAVGYTPLANTGNTIAITSYLEQFANLEDLQLFFQDQVPAAVHSSFTLIPIKGGQDNQSVPGAEANLDTQFAFGISHPIPATVYTTAGSPPFIPDNETPTDTNEPYLDWVEFVLNHPKLPQTISTSYGDDEQTVPFSYAQRVCQDFAQLGVRGVSLMFSSGDNGVGDGDSDPTTQKCFTNDGRNKTQFIPAFPSSCPFVTSVGGTTFIPETAVNFTGGGFSNYFARPAYQSADVSRFLHSLAPETYAGLFNSAGRAYPDVSTQANNFKVFLGGVAVHIGGTSAAAPTFAGIVSLLNDARLRAGKPVLGFLNPLLYTLKTGFNDITTGNNPGCGTPGFNATTGWDPVTGLGTPNFGVLKDLVLSV